VFAKLRKTGSAFSKKKPIKDTKVDSSAVIEDHGVIITSLLTLLHASLQKIEIHNEHGEENNERTLKIYARTKNSELLNFLKIHSQQEQEIEDIDIGLIIVIGDENIQENKKASELSVDNDSKDAK